MKREFSLRLQITLACAVILYLCCGLSAMQMADTVRTAAKCTLPLVTKQAVS